MPVISVPFVTCRNHFTPMWCKQTISRNRSYFDFALPTELPPVAGRTGIEPVTQILPEVSDLCSTVRTNIIQQNVVDVNTKLVKFLEIILPSYYNYHLSEERSIRWINPVISQSSGGKGN